MPLDLLVEQPLFVQWLRCHNYDPDRLTPQELKFLLACYDAETEPRAHDTPTSSAQGHEIRAAAAAAAAAAAPPLEKRDAGDLTIRGRMTIAAAAADGAAKSKRQITITAYTGGPMQLDWWDFPVIVDLDGIDAGDGVFPILDNHGPQRFSDESYRPYVIGQSRSARVENGQFIVEADLYVGKSVPAKEIADLADDGFNWQASIGAKATARDFIAEGNTVNVNGGTFEGPVYVARKTLIRETSVVTMGADGNTSVTVAASRRSPMPAIITKAATFSDYCKGMGVDEAALTEDGKAKLRAMYDDEDDDDGDEDKDKKEGAKAGAKLNLKAKAKTVPLATPVTADELLGEMRAKGATEAGRQAAITAIAAKYPGTTVEVNGKKVDLVAHAIAENWTTDQTELCALRASRARPSPHFYAPNAPQLSEAVLEAAVLQAGKCPLWDESRYEKALVDDRTRRETMRDLNARYTDQVQQAAHDLYRGRIGLHQLLTACCAGAGRPVGFETIRDDGQIEQVLRAADWSRRDPREIRAEGASTVSIQNVLANVLNKFLLGGYLFVEGSYKLISASRPVKDFKPTKSINVFGDYVYKKVNQDGQLESAAMTDEAFANAIDTFGRMLNLTRRIIIDDDISAMTTAPMLMGIGAADALNITFWTLWLNGMGNGPDGAAFWATRNVSATQLGGGALQANYISGGSSALSSAALQTAWYTFDKQVKPNGQPLGFDAEILLVPPELWVPGTELCDPKATTIVYGGGSAAKQPNYQIFAGRLKCIKSRYLSNSTYTGNSATAWWILANPSVCPTIEIAYLNGQETPTVQSAQAAFDTLGIMVRGFFDFGVAAQNVRGGVKSAGA